MEIVEWLTAILVTIVIRFYHYLNITLDNMEESGNATEYYSMHNSAEASQSSIDSTRSPVSSSTPNPKVVLPMTSTPVRGFRDLPVTVFEIKEEDTRGVIDVTRLYSRLKSPSKQLVLESVIAQEISPASEYYNRKYRYVPVKTEIGKKLIRI